MLVIAANILTTGCDRETSSPTAGSSEPKKLGSTIADQGFRDLDWGVDAIGIQGLKEKHRSGKLVTYTRPTDKLILGMAELQSIEYHFHDGKLFWVEIWSNPPVRHATAKDLRELLARMYGQGSEKTVHFPRTSIVDPHTTHVVWDDGKVAVDFILWRHDENWADAAFNLSLKHKLLSQSAIEYSRQRNNAIYGDR